MKVITQFTRYFAGLSWEIDEAIKDTEKKRHCTAVVCETINEGNGRKALKVKFEVSE